MAQIASDLTGILLIDKTSGWTSHDVVAKARRITGQRKIGHTGTLDPAATGLLVLCLGQATRLVEYLTGHDKLYTGEIALGLETDTDDADGTLVASYPVPTLDAARLGSLEERFTGAQIQVPPAFSAVKVEGRRAYRVARSGLTPDLPSRAVVIRALTLELLAGNRLGLRVQCGAGTYVRSLARDIGRELGCGAHLASLRRLVVGSFKVEEAVTLDELAALAGAGSLAFVLRAADDGIRDHDAAIISSEHARRLATGVRVSAEAERVATAARIYTDDGLFLGVGDVESGGQVRPRKLFVRAS